MGAGNWAVRGRAARKGCSQGLTRCCKSLFVLVVVLGSFFRALVRARAARLGFDRVFRPGKLLEGTGSAARTWHGGAGAQRFFVALHAWQLIVCFPMPYFCMLELHLHTSMKDSRHGISVRGDVFACMRKVRACSGECALQAACGMAATDALRAGII